jgi:hypothetical protein
MKLDEGTRNKENHFFWIFLRLPKEAIPPSRIQIQDLVAGFHSNKNL